MSRVAAVVLAAGAATRFGAPKQELLLPEVLRRLESSPVDEIVVVEGAYRLRDGLLQDRARLVRCAEWEMGPGASLRCGLAALEDDVAAAVVVLADGPRLSPDAIARVIESWYEEGGEVVAASYEACAATHCSWRGQAGLRSRTRGCASSRHASSAATTSGRPATSTRRPTLLRSTRTADLAGTVAPWAGWGRAGISRS